MNGFFLTFEGLDGSGKTTQLKLLAAALNERGFTDVVTTLEPGGTLLGRRLRETLLDKDLAVAPLAELLLFAADRAQHLQTLVLPALERGAIVLSDRYADATVAYQGAGRKLPPGVIAQVVELATSGLKPDLTLFFDLPVDVALLRTNRRAISGAEKNRLDSEARDFHERVRRGYLQIAAIEPERFRIVEASGSVDAIHAQTLEIVLPLLTTRNV